MCIHDTKVQICVGRQKSETAWGHLGRIPNSVLGNEIRPPGGKLKQELKAK